MITHFKNRIEAGQKLAGKLAAYKNSKYTIILGLPRGGIPVAHEVAKLLHLPPLDALIVRKLGVPGHRELAIGAIAVGGLAVFNQEIIESLNITDEAIKSVINEEKDELERRNKLYRGCKPPPEIKGKTIILVDDGLATGATMRAAVKALRKGEAKKIIVAVPVGSPITCDELSREADELICLLKPENFSAVGQFYQDFTETTDKETQTLLK